MELSSAVGLVPIAPSADVGSNPHNSPLAVVDVCGDFKSSPLRHSQQILIHVEGLSLQTKIWASYWGDTPGDETTTWFPITLSLSQIFTTLESVDVCLFSGL